MGRPQAVVWITEVGNAMQRRRGGIPQVKTEHRLSVVKGSEEAPVTRTELVKVTPEMAGDWLELNTRNRPIRPRWVTHLANTIKRGEWRVNGETIKLSSERLLDGQHRLLAIIEANTAIQTNVSFDVDDDAFATIDVGRPRTAGDILALDGHPNSQRLAAIARMLWNYERGYAVSMHNEIPTNVEIREIVERHPRLEEAARIAYQARHLLPGAIAGLLVYQFALRDTAYASIFWDALITGENLSKNSPIYRLRERLLANRASSRKMGAVELYVLTVKAWNAYRYNVPVQLLRYNADHPITEIMPSMERNAVWV